MAVRFVREEQMLCEDRTETASTDHDDVERPRVVLRTAIGTLSVRIRAGESFVHSVADVTAKHVPGKICFLRLLRRHLCNLLKRLRPSGMVSHGEQAALPA